MAVSNYDIALDRAREHFLTYDQEQMIRRFGLEHDPEYLYFNVLNRRYRLGRADGVMAPVDAPEAVCGFNETMTVFDVFCNSKPDASLSGRYCPVNSLKGIAQTSGLGNDLFAQAVKRLSDRPDVLRRSCEQLGGEPYPVGDVAYKLPLFDVLPMVLILWEGDDEFPPAMKMLWDENLLSYMRYETAYYAMAMILDRIDEIMNPHERRRAR
ncbi:MAG: DUF3786 domain-containing protein [Clostridia bacterium]|nr:DUF3786 domain-containing protein [Clostridia bacterium]